MKKILILGLMAFTLFSCEEDIVKYDGNRFVSFANGRFSEISVSENSGAYTLRVLLSTKATSDVTVSFETTDVTAQAGVNYSVPSSVVIPAGQNFADLPITITDDDEFNTTRKFEVSILSVSAGGYQIGIADEGSYYKEISIVNNDCPTQFSYWLGAVDVEDVGYGSTPGTASANANGDCDILVVNNNLPGASAPQNTIYNIVFTPTNAEGTEGTVSVAPTLVRTQVSGGVTYDAKYAGSGTYSTITGEVVINYQYRAYSQTTGNYVGNFWTGTNVIRLQ